jgi:hypothetical protein
MLIISTWLGTVELLRMLQVYFIVERLARYDIFCRLLRRWWPQRGGLLMNFPAHLAGLPNGDQPPLPGVV